MLSESNTNLFLNQPHFTSIAQSNISKQVDAWLIFDKGWGNLQKGLGD